MKKRIRLQLIYSTTLLFTMIICIITWIFIILFINSTPLAIMLSSISILPHLCMMLILYLKIRCPRCKFSLTIQTSSSGLKRFANNIPIHCPKCAKQTEFLIDLDSN